MRYICILCDKVTANPILDREYIFCSLKCRKRFYEIKFNSFIMANPIFPVVSLISHIIKKHKGKEDVTIQNTKRKDSHLHKG